MHHTDGVKDEATSDLPLNVHKEMKGKERQVTVKQPRRSIAVGETNSVKQLHVGSKAHLII